MEHAEDKEIVAAEVSAQLAVPVHALSFSQAALSLRERVLAEGLEL